jgi:hypothetical protein
MISVHEYEKLEQEEILKVVPSVTKHLDELIRRAAMAGDRQVSSLGFRKLNKTAANEVVRLYTEGGWQVQLVTKASESNCKGDESEPETRFVLVMP